MQTSKPAHQIFQTLSDELILYASQGDLYLLDPKKLLTPLFSMAKVVRRGDTRQVPHLEPYDRLNMMEVNKPCCYQ